MIIIIYTNQLKAPVHQTPPFRLMLPPCVYFHLGWLEGWHEAFLGWLKPPHATPVEPPLRISFKKFLDSYRDPDCQQEGFWAIPNPSKNFIKIRS